MGLAWIGMCCVLQAQPSSTLSPSRKATAQALFERGKARMREHKYIEAAALFEQSQALDSGVGTRLYLADCYEHLGRLASAWAMFHEAASAAAERGEVERAQMGLERAASLQPRIPHLVLQVTRPTAPGLSVSVNGMELSDSAWDIPLPVDPGESTIELRAPGFQPYSAKRVVVEGGDALVVALPALTPSTPPDRERPVVEGASRIELVPQMPLASSPGMHDEPTRSWQRPSALVAGGVAVLVGGIGAYFGVRAIALNNEAKSRCSSSTPCADTDGVRYSERANSAARMANGFVLGSLLLAGLGATLWLTAPAPTSPRVSAHADAQSLQLQLAGAF